MPQDGQLPGPCVRVNRTVGQVDPGPVIRTTFSVRIDSSAVGAGHVNHILVGITVVIDPSLDNLQALQRCTFEIGRCHQDEAGRFSVTVGA